MGAFSLVEMGAFSFVEMGAFSLVEMGAFSLVEMGAFSFYNFLRSSFLFIFSLNDRSVKSYIQYYRSYGKKL